MSTPTPTPTEALPALGTPMPDLALVGPDGAITTLHSVRGAERAVVYFLRAASCPACLHHAAALAGLAAEGRLGPEVRVLLVTPGSAAEAARVRRKVAGDAVTVWASGEGGEGHAAAGLGSFLRLQHSGTFVVAGDGTVVHRRTAALPPLSFSRAELLEVLGR